MARLIYQTSGIGATFRAYFNRGLEIGWNYFIRPTDITVRACFNRVLEIGRDYFIRPAAVTANPPEHQSPKYQGAKLSLPVLPIIYDINPARPPLIEYRKVSAKYHLDKTNAKYHSDQADALKDISFSVKAGERLGIVGQTASGKSTALRCLLQGGRNLKMSPDSSIFLNGMDIEHIDLSELREEITYISEDPGLFGGSVWENIDQDFEIDEDIIISSFQAVKEPISPQCGNQLGVGPSANSNATNPLQTICIDNILNIRGLQLTPSQRQLIALARAIAHHKSSLQYESNRRIVLLDDPTSSLDAETNAAIQGVIRREFKTCTILMVSNNLANVIDYDRIMVMKEGTILEMGRPEELVKNNAMGIFARMVNEAVSAGLQLKKVGSDWEGYNREGFDESGYDRKGFNNSGLDRDGYFPSGFAPDGYDRDGRTPEMARIDKEWSELCCTEMVMDRRRKRDFAAEMDKRMTEKLGPGYDEWMPSGMLVYVEMKKIEISRKLRRDIRHEQQAMRR